MTRVFFLVGLLFFCARVVAQPAPIVYSGVEHVAEVPADELFSRALIWVSRTYKSAQHVLQMADNNRLVGKSNIPFSYSAGIAGTAHCRLKYTFLIECRDGRYRYVIDRIYLFVRPHGTKTYDNYGELSDAETLPEESAWKSNLPNKHRQQLWRKAKEYMSGCADALAASLKEQMGQTTTDNDW